ncbi:hypothetical protein C8R32_10818 [Nitrosospira sp. Nsp5]|uniref:Uncharacterized protein n=1 Tax=Nitrosospira multiformis TaxID=1231 RepID=A0ABY0TBD4_9PROT|nr:MULTISPECIES: hypothetical protein [Nitrosospira]PTR07063.1 hypothetical protein C8R32_10818 [Nitrosospira sp. Nsp5]SDQ32789.1 hypothetical protein SAMN05216402_0396 [Nitrosospira multiformis]
MIKTVQFTLSFTGNDSDRHLIDFYDVSKALIGFQRSIALTTHLVLNNEIITQAPYLKGATIYALPSEAGSWKMTAVVMASLYHLGTAPINTPIGHLIHSLYDYVVSESLGFHVDYDKTLKKLYDESDIKKTQLPQIRESQAHSLVEKCSPAIEEMHRPIYKGHTAKKGRIVTTIGDRKIPLQQSLTIETYDFIHETHISAEPEEIQGRISGYYKNTFKGKIFDKSIGWPVSFELRDQARNRIAFDLIIRSLHANALSLTNENSIVFCKAYRMTSKSGQLKGFLITEVSSKPLS